MITAEEQLRKAADLIEEHGHCRGVFVNEGQICLATALARAAEIPISPDGSFGSMPGMDAFNASPAMVALHLDMSAVCEINNEPGFGKDEAVAWLREQADNLTMATA